jgi:alpha-glucosidase
VHVRGGSVLPLQEPGYTTTETRANPWGILVALDSDRKAKGDLYLDNGESLVPNATKIVNVSETGLAWRFVSFFNLIYPMTSPTDNRDYIQFSYHHNTLTAHVNGSYHSTAPLANITIAGLASTPQSVHLTMGSRKCSSENLFMQCDDNGVLRITGLEQYTGDGAWEGDIELGFEM